MLDTKLGDNILWIIRVIIHNGPILTLIEEFEERFWKYFPMLKLLKEENKESSSELKPAPTFLLSFA